MISGSLTAKKNTEHLPSPKREGFFCKSKNKSAMGPNLPGANWALFNLGGVWRKTPKLEDDPASASFSGAQTRFLYSFREGCSPGKKPETNHSSWICGCKAWDTSIT